jgi:hypothetical protein
MAGYTTYFNLLELGPNDPWATDNNQFSTSDRVVIDAVLQIGAVTHHHDGASAAGSNPSTAPTLSQTDSGGYLPAGVTVYYEYTWASPIGLETTPSPVGNIVMPTALVVPATPTVTPITGAGTLSAGTYNYCITAYNGISTQETLASVIVSATLTATGEVEIEWTPVAGADGINIYQMIPGGAQLLYLTSVVEGAAPVTSFIDNGTLTANCNRYVPSQNVTNNQNVVTGTIVAAPAGWTANVYRTFQSGQWGSSQIASGLTGTSFTDSGAATTVATPPTASRIPADPSKVLLTDGAEVQGVLPSSMVAGFPFATQFSFPGVAAVETAACVWVCPFTSCQVVSVTAVLDQSSTPAVYDDIVDVLYGPALAGATPVPSNPPVYTSIFAAATPVYPVILVGEEVGAAVVPPGTVTVLKGDTLSAAILQAGGGATPTDSNLQVNVYLLVTAL